MCCLICCFVFRFIPPLVHLHSCSWRQKTPFQALIDMSLTLEMINLLKNRLPKQSQRLIIDGTYDLPTVASYSRPRSQTVDIYGAQFLLDRLLGQSLDPSTHSLCLLLDAKYTRQLQYFCFLLFQATRSPTPTAHYRAHEVILRQHAICIIHLLTFFAMYQRASWKREWERPAGTDCLRSLKTTTNRSVFSRSHCCTVYDRLLTLSCHPSVRPSLCLSVMGCFIHCYNSYITYAGYTEIVHLRLDTPIQPKALFTLSHKKTVAENGEFGGSRTFLRQCRRL